MAIVERIQLIFEGINRMTAPVRAVSQSIKQVEMDTQAYQNVAANANITTRESAKFFRENNLQMQSADTAVNTLTGRTQSLGQVTDNASKAAKRFNFSWLSVMFAGMALNRVFGGMIKSQLKLFGITELLGGVFTLVMLPVMMMLLPLFLLLSQIMINLSPEMKIVVGVLIVMAAIFGIILLIVGQAMLAIMGLGMIFGITGSLAMLAVFGIVLILIGLGLVIAGIIIIIQNWGKNWIKVMKGIAIALVGLAFIFLGVMAIMVASGVAAAAIMWIAWTAGIILIVAAIILLGVWWFNHWQESKEVFTIVWAAIKNTFFSAWNGIIDFFEWGVNKMIKLANLTPGINIEMRDFGKFKADLIDMDALLLKVGLQRRARLKAEEEAKAGRGSDGLFDSLIPDQFQTGLNSNASSAALQEININNNNTFNVSDKEEMERMLNENNLKIVEDIKRQINP